MSSSTSATTNTSPPTPTATNSNKPKGRGRKKTKNPKVKLPENERLVLQKHIVDFLNGSDGELVLNGLSKSHRHYLHLYCMKIGLKTQSYGKTNDRVLHIRRRQRKNALGDTYKLNLKRETREYLLNLTPRIEKRMEVHDELQQQQQQRHQKVDQQHSRQHHREQLLMRLKSRMVPPPPNSISSELYRDKQELPIYAYHDELLAMMKKHSVIVVNGETGSGKTTQVPQYILNEACRQGRACRVLVSQPRRVACVSVATRVAEERGEPLGETVGYQIRLESRLRKTTNLIYTTSGCLLRSIMADKNDLFGKITHLIIDEIHERDKNTDFTLITVKEQLKRNKDLRLILMSATMDIGMLSKYFDNCPVLNVPGQAYDVKIYYLEDILFHTGYRTALMEKYLRMSESQLNVMPANAAVGNSVSEWSRVPVRLTDEYMQHLIDNILYVCGEATDRSDDELSEYFDQMLYYIESEGMSVDVGHSLTSLTPLMAACKRNHCKYVQAFLERSADVELVDADGKSAFDYAYVHSDQMCFSLLQRLGKQAQQPPQSQPGQQSHYNQQEQLTREDGEKERIMAAYQQQFNDDNEVDHDLILSLLEGLYRSAHPGAIMVFLPGYSDILQQRDLINSTLPPDTYRICVLHGQMDSQDQAEALRWQRVRKIILSTNIGQTSITIPDLAFVIDSGKVKMKAYDSITESSALQPIWISKADAEQRSGRAGRTQNGVCYRLYSRAKHEHMLKFCQPEFLRIPLTEICLYAKTLDDSIDVQTYLGRALNTPSKINVYNALKKLQVMKVFTADETVTELGRHLVEIPLDVQLGKCLLYGIFMRCFDAILTIVAFHSVKDPYVLPTDRTAQGQASFLRKAFSGQTFSDQIGILELYKGYAQQRNNRKRARQFCAKYYLSHPAMEMFCATRRQLFDSLQRRYNLTHHCSDYSDDMEVVRFCLTAGFYPNIAYVDRQTCKVVSGSENNLLLQRTSALNPPGMKNIKEFVHMMPHNWIVFYEKSRVINKCSINMNTVVSPVVVVLLCGRDCVLEDDEPSAESSVDDENDELDDIDPEELAELNEALDITNAMKKLTTKEDNTAVISLDGWIKMELNVADAKLLMAMRDFVQAEFQQFLLKGLSPDVSMAASSVQKLLHCGVK